MSNRREELEEDVHSSVSFGHIISTAPHHFSRVFSYFGPQERMRLFEIAFDFYRTVDFSTYSREQMVAGLLYIEDPEDERFKDWDGNLGKIQLNDLSSSELTTVVRTISGQSYIGLAGVLSKTLLDPALDGQTEFDDLFKKAFGHAIVSPQLAAAVASCTTHSRQDFDRFENSSTNQIADARIIPKELLPNRRVREGLELQIDGLRELLQVVQNIRPQLLDAAKEMVQPESLYSRFGLQELASGLYVPKRTQILIATRMEDAVKAVHAKKDAIRAMSPRDFEEFLSHIFSNLGFAVELTKTTRDGGADLLCLRNLHGITFRLAVEIKRYKDERPVDVSLVRAFVGANQQHRANQLLFVTTSSYTKPAIQYAQKYCSPHFLALKDYVQIKDWCATLIEANPSIV